MISRHKSTMATKRKKAAEEANVTISTIEAISPLTPFYEEDSDLTNSDEEEGPRSLIEVPAPARSSRNNTPMTHLSSHDPDDIDDVVALNTERNKRNSAVLGIRRRGKGSEPTISTIMQNYNSGIQAPEEGRPSIVDFTPFVGEAPARDDDLDEGDFDYDKNPEVSDMHLNPFNSHVIKKEFHPYQLLLPVYRFFQNSGGEIEFDAEKFTLKIRKYPLRWTSIRPEPGAPMNHDVSDGKPAANKPSLNQELKSHDLDDDFMSSASIELKPDTPEQPEKAFMRLNTVKSDVHEDDFNDYDQAMEHEEMVNIYCTCVRRKSDGDNLFTVYSKHGDLSFAARRQLRSMLDQLFHRIAPFTDMPYYDEEEEDSRDIY